MTAIPAPGTAVELQSRDDAPSTVERGVILHPGLSWAVAYFPGEPECFADPDDPAAIRTVDSRHVVRYLPLTACPPEWVLATWHHVARHGAGYLQAPAVTQIWDLAAQLAHLKLSATQQSGLVLRKADLDEWTGRSLTEREIARLTLAVPGSGIPLAVSDLADRIAD